MVDLYQRVSTHLSVVRSTASDPVLEARLSALVASARSVVTGVTLPVWQTIGRFFTVVFPAAVYRARFWWITIGVINIALALLIGWRVVNTPGLADTLLTDDEVKQLVDHDFAQYYAENPAADFAFQVWLNNAEVTAICLVLGIAILPVLVLLWFNIANLGVIGGFMVGAGRADVFYGLLLPARAARADDRLRRRRRRAAAWLVLDRSGQANPRPGSGRRGTCGRSTGPRACGLAPAVRTGRGLRHAVDAAGRGEADHRRARLAGVPDLRLHPRPAGGAGRPDRRRRGRAHGARAERSCVTHPDRTALR